MPIIAKKSSRNGKQSKNGQAPSSRAGRRSPSPAVVTKRPRFTDRLLEERQNQPPGSDKIRIGSEHEGGGEELAVLTMADAAKKVSGIKYLVRDWIPFGMLTMIVADSGIGKSGFALYSLVRPIITGGSKWFSGLSGPSKPGNVLWIDTEGTVGITVDRITKWGMQDATHRIKLFDEGDVFGTANLDNDCDLARIESIINRHKTKLVVIDSLRGSHAGDENNSRIARILQELAGIAARTNAAIIIIHHTRKLQDGEEISAGSSRGSNAIYAMVRSQLGLDKPDEQSDWVRVQMMKENLGLRPAPFGFRIHNEGIEYGAAPEKPREESQKAKAEDFLREMMTRGKWHDAAELLADAKEFGFSANAIQRAREVLGITTSNGNVKKRDNGKWQWRYPA